MPRRESDSRPGRAERLVPLAATLRSYDRSWLRGDVIAGVTVAALIVPKNLGYAGIAGVPLQNGLYAAAAAAILYAIFGSCRQISMGPSSGLAAVAASAVATAGLTSAPDIAAFVAAITIASGVLFVLLALLRMGWVARFLSRAVVTGFLFGAAIDVVIGELPKLTGTDSGGSNSFQELRWWVRSLPDADRTTALLGAVSLIVVFGLRVVAPKVPGALVLVVGGLVASYALDLDTRGVALVGDVPRGLPSFSLPSTALVSDHVATIVVAAVALTLIGFSQTAGDARTFAAKHGYQIDMDQESTAQAAANLGSGVLQGMPVSTSLSASSLNDRSGAKTGLASLTSGVTVLLTLLVLAPLFSQLPKAVLGALIIEAVVMGVMNVAEMRRIYRVQRFDFWVAMAAIVATLAFGVLAGVVIGIALSLLWLIAVATRPMIPVLGREPGTQVYRDIVENPDDELAEDIRVLRLDGGLFFATADALEDTIRDSIVNENRLRCVVLDCEGINFLDSQGSATLDDVIVLCRQAGIDLRLARVKPTIRAVLDREGTLDRLGTANLHGNVHRAVEAERASWTEPGRG